jgi:protoporphyrinogen oxidase
MVPNKNQTSFSAEYTIDENGKLSDQELIKKTIKTLTETLSFAKKNEIKDSFVLRAQWAYPVYTLDYKRKTKALKNYLKTFKNLQTTGRAGLFRYNNMDHSILSGIYAARNIEGEDFDLDQINVDQEYLEEKKKQD